MVAYVWEDLTCDESQARELSAALRLSSGQEQRISDAVNRKTAQFDKLMKEFDRNSEEEKNWRYKMNASRYEMVKLNRGIPDTIREFLDDEQREKYDSMVTADNKPAAAVSPAAETPAPAVRASKPRKMKRVLRRKKAQVQAPAPAAPAAAVPADDEAGQVMVDKEPAARSKAAPAQEEDAGSYP